MAKKQRSAKSGNRADLGFEEKLWATADKLRGHMDAAEYKHVVLGLVFLKYISDAFQELHDALAAHKHSDAEDRDEYIAENVVWVKKILKKHGYPPDKQAQATETVLKQAELLCADWAE